MPTGNVERRLEEGFGPSREALFDSKRLGINVRVRLVPHEAPADDSEMSAVERFINQRKSLVCRVTLIGDTRRSDTPWRVNLVSELSVEGEEVRLVLDFMYSTDNRFADGWVKINWTTERCRDEHGGGCGELLWPDEGPVCMHYPACCTA